MARPYLSEKRRFIKRVGADTIDELIRLRKAADLAHGHERSFEKDLDLFKERVDALRKESPPLRVFDLAVNGHDVMEVLGIEPGPRVGESLNQLLDAVIEKPAHNQKISR